MGISDQGVSCLKAMLCSILTGEQGNNGWNRLGTVAVPLQQLSHWRGMHVDWDSRARKTAYGDEQRAHPYQFEVHLRKIMGATLDLHATYQGTPALPSGDSYITVNGWNEWSEGNTMEPSTLNGRGFLEALHNVVLGQVKDARICFMISASPLAAASEDLEATLRSIAALGRSEWAALVYTTEDTTAVPVGLMNTIRGLGDARMRYIDVPNPAHITGPLVLKYILPRCSNTYTAHYTVHLAAGDTVVALAPALSWEEPMHLTTDSSGNAGPRVRAVNRIGQLQMDAALVIAHNAEWRKYTAPPISR
jgi:hypothetical protein